MTAAWEKRREARQSQRQKRADRPAPAPSTSKPSRRGAAPKGTQFGTGQRDMFQSLQAKPIATPARGNVSGRGKRSPAPASTPTENTGGMTNNTSVTPVNGSFRTAVEQGKDGKRTSGSGNAGSGVLGRSETRTNALQVQQTGTNTGFKGSGFGEANAMLQRMGISGVGYGDFESTALPGGRNQPNINGNAEGSTNKTDQSVEIEGQMQQNADGGVQTPTKETKLVTEGGIKVTNPLQPGSRAEYDRQFGRSDLTAMQGMRAAEASKGLLYASGKYWRANPNAGQDGQKDFLEISKDEYRSIKSGDQHAKDFAADKIEQVKKGMTLNNAPEGYENPEGSKPIHQMPAVPNYEAPEAKVTTEYTLTDAPQFTDKDKTGRYNMFR